MFNPWGLDLTATGQHGWANHGGLVTSGRCGSTHGELLRGVMVGEWNLDELMVK